MSKLRQAAMAGGLYGAYFGIPVTLLLLALSLPHLLGDPLAVAIVLTGGAFVTGVFFTAGFLVAWRGMRPPTQK